MKMCVSTPFSPRFCRPNDFGPNTVKVKEEWMVAIRTASARIIASKELIPIQAGPCRRGILVYEGVEDQVRPCSGTATWRLSYWLTH